MKLAAAALVIALIQEAPLAGVKRYAVQFQNVDLAALAKSPSDLLVIDHSRDFPSGSTYAPEDYAQLRARSKRVIAYLSIGSAQTSRFYWKKEWKSTPPAWLGPRDDARREAFFAKYWNPAWQSIISGARESCLDRLIDAGYDGVMLDAIDSYAYWQNQGEAEAREHMVTWVQALSLYARKRNGHFLVLAGGGEELLADGRFLSSIDGLVRSDAYLGGGTRRAEADIARSEDQLDRGAKAGKRIFILETTEKAADAEWVAERCGKKGYLAYCGPAGFGSLSERVNR